MVVTVVVDALLVLTLLVLLVTGARHGFARSAGSIAGLAAGGVAAYVVMPLVTRTLAWPAWRTLVIVVASILLLVAGHAVGRALGRAAAGGDRTRPTGVSRLFGAATSAVVGALTISLVAGGIAQLGAPVISQAAQQSAVVRGIASLTPDPVDTLIASIRASILATGLGEVDGAAVEFTEASRPDSGDPTPSSPAAPASPESDATPPVSPTSPGGNAPPPVAPATPSSADAAELVVRLSGTAFSCGMHFTGSGAVIGDNRILTNAHVVAGVATPIVETPGAGSVEGTVVYFDPDTDLAVVATHGLPSAHLELDAALAEGDTATVAGYPFGGPYAASAVHVRSLGTARMPNIYDSALVEREVYILEGTLHAGQSGGPVLDDDGDLVGLLFGKAPDGAPTGYALSRDELATVIDAAPTLTAPVSTGGCPALGSRD